MFQDLCILNICFSKLIVTLHLDDLYDLDEERFSSTSSRWKHVIYIVQTPVLCTIILYYNSYDSHIMEQLFLSQQNVKVLALWLQIIQKFVEKISYLHADFIWRWSLAQV